MMSQTTTLMTILDLANPQKNSQLLRLLSRNTSLLLKFLRFLSYLHSLFLNLSHSKFLRHTNSPNHFHHLYLKFHKFQLKKKNIFLFLFLQTLLLQVHLPKMCQDLVYLILLKEATLHTQLEVKMMTVLLKALVDTMISSLLGITLLKAGLECTFPRFPLKR